jgi:hypothetical protein
MPLRERRVGLKASSLGSFFVYHGSCRKKIMQGFIVFSEEHKCPAKQAKEGKYCRSISKKYNE